MEQYNAEIVVGSSAAPVVDRHAGGMRKINVFISHASADRAVAEVLREEIIDLNRDRIDCFLDSKTIEAGQGWERTLDNALRAADWLLCIFTGEQSEFCGYEVGVFTSGKALERTAGDSRLVCIHDVEAYPTLFKAHQNSFVKYPPEQLPSGDTFDETTFYANSDLVKLFQSLSQFNKLYVPNSEAEYHRQSQSFIRKAKLVTEAFRIARGDDVRFDTPTQLSLEVSVSAKPGDLLDRIPPNATAKGTSATFSLFNMRPFMTGEQLPAVKWEEITTASKTSAGYLPWIERLEQDMLSAANKRVLQETEATFRGKDKTYRAILVRHLIQWDGTHRFIVVFVETLPRQFVGDQNTSMILAGLVVASRFRFAFLEQPERVSANFNDQLSLNEFEAHYRQFFYDLERMQQESMELGLLDHTTFVNAFGPSRKAVAEGFMETWKRARKELSEGLPPAGTAITSAMRRQIKTGIDAFLKEMASENSRFLQVSLEAYTEELKKELRRTPANLLT